MSDDRNLSEDCFSNWRRAEHALRVRVDFNLDAKSTIIVYALRCIIEGSTDELAISFLLPVALPSIENRDYPFHHFTPFPTNIRPRHLSKVTALQVRACASPWRRLCKRWAWQRIDQAGVGAHGGSFGGRGDLLRAKADPSKFPAEEAAIVTYVRQLMRTNRAEQGTFDALQGKHGTKWLVELTTGVHYYAMLCGVVNAFEVAAPPDGDKLPA